MRRIVTIALAALAVGIAAAPAAQAATVNIGITAGTRTGSESFNLTRPTGYSWPRGGCTYSMPWDTGERPR